ncbi:MAG: terminase, partial [Nitriliruptor sp.]
LDPWQRLVLEEGLGEAPGGQWAAFQVAIEVSRQNGKGAILEARELAGLFVLDERLIIHTAHEFATSLEAYRRILELIESTPDLDRRVRKVMRSNQERGLELKSGQRLLFKARSRGGGRGFSGDCVILDEAFELPIAAHGALLPTLSARPNPQVWYASSAVNQQVHPHGVVLSQLRSRAIAGGDPSLCYCGWSVDEDEYYANPEAVAVDPRFWAIGNPGMGIRITPEYIANEQRGMDAVTFATERLGVGDWPDPDEDASRVIARETWDGLADMDSKIDGPVAFAFDVNPERTYAAIAASGKRADGRKHLEVIDHKAGTRWVLPELLRLVDKWEPCAIVVDGNGPAASLIAELEEAGIGMKADGGLLVKATVGDMAQACGALFDAALSDEVRHLGQSMLDAALRGARKRDRGDAWTWSRQSGADISPLVAVTLAAHGHAVHGHADELEPFAILG